MKSRIPEVLLTKDGAINIADDVFINGLKDVKEQFRKNQILIPLDKEFLLIGRRHLRTNNSWMHNIERLAKGKNKCTVMIHPTDAGKLKLIDTQEVKVSSKTGTINIPIEITENIMPGVVSIPHGFGHNKKGTQLSLIHI